MRHWTRLSLTVPLVFGFAALPSACADDDPDPSPGGDAGADVSAPPDDASDAGNKPDGSEHPDTGNPDADSPEGDGAVETEASTTCGVPYPTDCTEPQLRYSDVDPILSQRCRLCHGTVPGNWPFVDYGHVYTWIDDIYTTVATCKMPPPDAGVPMTNEERLKIVNWIRCGAPNDGQ